MREREGDWGVSLFDLRGKEEKRRGEENERTGKLEAPALVQGFLFPLLHWLSAACKSGFGILMINSETDTRCSCNTVVTSICSHSKVKGTGKPCALKDVAKVRTMMKKNGFQKTPGCSLAKLRKEVYISTPEAQHFYNPRGHVQNLRHY
ncbi:hypothetical protein IFM89_020900 [Coptis chinensis]|uniref:Uncharacterized protein n=1 Tax=Coptis chinensis TaxID=261450 RepID=A0A835H7P3_9MAGN|nr:hypothetical protein IFM89_020900 [Coptis chinensis]